MIRRCKAGLPSDVEDIIARVVRLVKERVISSGDSETNTNNDEGEKQITEKEKEAQLAKQKQEEEGKAGGAGKILPLNSNNAQTTGIPTEENQLEPDDVPDGGGN